MAKTIISMMLITALLLLPCSFAALVTTEDFETGWTAGFNYGEFVAHDFSCDDTAHVCKFNPSFTPYVGTAGVTIVNETDGPQYLRLYSIYESVSTRTYKERLTWNIENDAPEEWLNITDFAIGFNMRVQDIQEVYSTVNYFSTFPYTSYLGANIPLECLTTPSATYCGMATTWDSGSVNINDYPYTFTGFVYNDYSTTATSEFIDWGSCYLPEDEWGTVFIRYRINNTGSDLNSVTGQAFYINGEKCLDVNITSAHQRKYLRDVEMLSQFRFNAQNQVIDIDNINVYTYNLDLGDIEEDIRFDMLKDSVITEPGSDYNPVDSDQLSIGELLFGNVYQAKWLLLIALFLVGFFIVVGSKFAGFTGAGLLGGLSTIAFTVIGWIPIWVTVLVIIMSAIAFGSKVSGLFNGD